MNERFISRGFEAIKWLLTGIGGIWLWGVGSDYLPESARSGQVLDMVIPLAIATVALAGSAWAIAEKDSG